MQFATDSHLKLIQNHQSRWCDCQLCPLGKDGSPEKNRTNVVLWKGYIPCDVLFIGEAPARDEDADVEPFTGRSGQLLHEIITDTIASLVREDNYSPNTVAYTNTVCCLPLNSKGELREPTEGEIAACNDRLQEFLGIAQPTVIVLVGDVANSVRATLSDGTVRIFSIVHPAYILRQPNHIYTQLYHKTITLLREAWQATVPF
jgi:uracil-DNA glycosylase family 4